ncbi:hypothetical protein INT43_004175 [Umbelopsis isabellina]|uniref:Uncharacterized protein n=1 Tax=Mortierella isabellina TaxID=91625 RepID=A0A8H7U926_MORIS|nr:hypothetical protein INT43_004175 [Umbelopsis isabellina]
MSSLSAHPFDHIEPFNVYEDSDTDSISDDFQSMAISEIQFQPAYQSLSMNQSTDPELPVYALRRRNAIVGELPDAPSKLCN